MDQLALAHDPGDLREKADHAVLSQRERGYMAYEALTLHGCSAKCAVSKYGDILSQQAARNGLWVKVSMAALQRYRQSVAPYSGAKRA